MLEAHVPGYGEHVDFRQRSVREFHLTCAQAAPQRPDAQHFPADLRAQLVREETAELVEAHAAADLVEMIDALCDLLYVTYGAAVALGVDLGDLTPRGDEIGAPALERLLVPASIAAAAAAADELEGACRSREADAITQAAVRLISEIDTLAGWAGLDLAPFFDEVHRSNMDKSKGPRRPDGKQLKPADWRPPQIAALLAARYPGQRP